MNRYKLQVTGYSYKYFLSTLIRNKIELYYIHEEKNKLIVIVNSDDYKRIKKIKTSCKIRILNRFGMEKVKYLIYKYRYLLLFFLLGLGMIIFLSNIIFTVEVIHPKEEIRELIYNDLEKYGLKKYHFVFSYSEKEKIKRKILSEEKTRIEWLEIDRVGTKYVVNVEERKKKKVDTDTSPRDIVAKKDCMILSINAQNGEVVKKKYDYVKKGDVIVSGTIKNKEDEVSKIKAQGQIFGEVWYKVTTEIPVHYYEENPTGKKKRVLTLKVLDKKISLELKRYQNYSFREVKIFENLLLPISLVVEEKRETKVIEKEYSIDNVDKKAIEIAKSKFKEKNIILEKVLKKSLNNSRIIVDIFFKVREDITDYRKITDLSLREEKDE